MELVYGVWAVLTACHFKKKRKKKESSQGGFLIWHALPQARSCDELEHPTSTPTARPCLPVQLTLRTVEAETQAAVCTLDGIIYGSCLLKLQSSRTGIEGSRRLALLCFFFVFFLLCTMWDILSSFEGRLSAAWCCSQSFKGCSRRWVAKVRWGQLFAFQSRYLLFFFALLCMAEVQISWEWAASLKSS